MWARTVAAAVTALAVAFVLEGCGGGDEPTPAPTEPPTSTSTSTTTLPPPTTTVTTPAGWQGFKLPIIEVVGSHLVDSTTKKRFNAKGMCMPNVGNNPDDWIAVIRRIRKDSAQINTLRLYSVPHCAYASDCFEPFVIEADTLGFYLLLPGTGTEWGWLPGHENDCPKPANLQNCYQAGGVLGFGQTIIQHFNYPNILAIVMGNEFDMQMRKYIPILKAYARDLKVYMNMCNNDPESPSYETMRMIPLMYASSDDEGDVGVIPKAKYMFCSGPEVSVDIFGLNIERYCSDKEGQMVYKQVNSWVTQSKFPGAFFFSEDGCTRTVIQPDHIRTWSQAVNFFSNFPAISGFTAYTYYGNVDFDMYDGPYANATMNKDGAAFLKSMQSIGDEPTDASGDRPMVPFCPPEILKVPMADFNEITIYDTGPAGWAINCPHPPPGPPKKPRAREMVF